MIRIILVALFLILYLILGIPILIVEWIIGKFNKQAMDISTLRIVQWAFHVILFLTGTKITVIGEENVPTDQAVLYICNHRSYFDIVITYSRCKRLTGYIAKDNMLKIPLLNIWMKRVYCLFLNRTDMKEGLKTILTGIEQLKNGISMCIFPEGTRNRSADQMDMLPFKAGSFKMAEKSGCPIVPMAITNSADILENHIPFVHKAHVVLQYGKPILPNELSKEDKKRISSLVQDEVRSMLTDNQKYL
jgi:1-acyl-sn-glycerol-3-phosphate acyltransferase